MIYIFAISFLLIAIGELADKSQLLALLLATRYRAWQVLTGIFAATLVVHFFTALAGQTLGAFIPARVLPVISGVLFVGFGVWTLRGDEVTEDEAERGSRSLGPVLATFVAFFLAELGDKTQIMTLTIAADPGSALLGYVQGAGPVLGQWARGAEAAAAATGPVARFWAVTFGSTLGMVAADAVAIGIGRLLGRKLPERGLRIASGVIFIAFGVLSAASVFFQRG